MPLWQRLLITLAVMLLASYLVGLLWQWMFTADIRAILAAPSAGSARCRHGSSCGGSVRSTNAETALRCYSEPVMSDREIADLYLFLRSLSGRG